MYATTWGLSRIENAAFLCNIPKASTFFQKMPEETSAFFWNFREFFKKAGNVSGEIDKDDFFGKMNESNQISANFPSIFPENPEGTGPNAGVRE